MSNGSRFERSAKVIQASGMVSVQATCTFDEAVALMQARADETQHTIDEIAGGVLDRSIRFDNDSGHYS